MITQSSISLSKQNNRTNWVGAASLLYRNNDSLWPEFTGRDLSSSGFDSLEILAQDGARMPDVLGNQLPIVSENAALITLTIGGNDLLYILEKFRTLEAIEIEAPALDKEYAWIVDRIHQQAPNATIVCTTIFDPTDGTGQFRAGGAPVPIHLLYKFNEAVERTCAERSFTKFADVCKHFAGHGTSAVGDERWFWSGSVIEPSARGASEIRRVWLEALGM